MDSGAGHATQRGKRSENEIAPRLAGDDSMCRRFRSNRDCRSEEPSDAKNVRSEYENALTRSNSTASTDRLESAAPANRICHCEELTFPAVANNSKLVLNFSTTTEGGRFAKVELAILEWRRDRS